MGRRTPRTLSALFAPLILVALSGGAAAESLTFAFPDNSSTAPLLDIAARNASALPAKARRAGENFLEVRYRGEAKNFVRCSNMGAAVTGGFALDARSTFEARGPRLQSNTLYIVTFGKGTPTSLAFTSTDGGKANGLTCQATGELERTLLGMK